jgi:hypothetical protein
MISASPVEVELSHLVDVRAVGTSSNSKISDVIRSEFSSKQKKIIYCYVGLDYVMLYFPLLC